MILKRIDGHLLLMVIMEEILFLMQEEIDLSSIFPILNKVNIACCALYNLIVEIDLKNVPVWSLNTNLPRVKCNNLRECVWIVPQ